MINLGEAGNQKEGGRGPIPRGSVVKVKMELRRPKKPDAADAAVTVYGTGLKGLDCEFVVVAGRFEGVKIWENWFLPPGMQEVALTKGQEGACNGGFAKMRAVVESARNLDPHDPAANRNINSWFDLHGLEIAVKIGIAKPNPGDQYINNNIIKIVVPGDNHYAEVMAGGEIITDEPFPELAPLPDTKPNASGPPAGWGAAATPTPAPADPHKATPAPAPTPPPISSDNIPDWAK